jgi:hypothetical protein
MSQYNSHQRSGLYAGGQFTSVQPRLLKPNKITKAEITYIDAAKQVDPRTEAGACTADERLYSSGPLV